MKVLHVIPSISARDGGPSKAIFLYAESARRQGMRVSIATTEDSPGSHLRLQTPIPTAPDTTELFSFPRTTLHYKVSLGLARWLRTEVADFDLVHIHALFSFSSTAAAWAARRAKVPYIVRPLGVLNQWGIVNRRATAKKLSLRLIESRIVCGAAAMHYTSESERTEAQRALPELKGVRSAIIPVPLPDASSAVDPAAATNQFIRRYPQAKGRQIILFLSRIDAKKGVDLLLMAFSRVAAKRADPVLFIAGDGDEGFIQGLKNSVPASLTDRVNWTGWLGGEAKDAALASATMFVLPSYSENFGVAVAEALSAGTATIVTEGVALADELKEAGAALVVPPDATMLAAAMERLLDDKTLRLRLATAGKALASERYSMERVGPSLKELYLAVASGSAAR